MSCAPSARTSADCRHLNEAWLYRTPNVVLQSENVVNTVTYLEHYYIIISSQLSSVDNGVARIFFWGGGTRPMPPGPFSVISKRRPDSVGGGGVVAEIFQITAGEDHSNYLNSGNFFYIYGPPGGHPPFLSLTTSIHYRKKTFTKSLGGRAPPPGYATVSGVQKHTLLFIQ